MRINCTNGSTRLCEIEAFAKYFKSRGDATTMEKVWNDQRQDYDRILIVREIEVG